MSDPLSEKQLAQIRAWCASVLKQYKVGGGIEFAYADAMCGYTDSLPTNSVRSTVTTLLAECERLRASQEELSNDLGNAIDAEDAAERAKTRWETAHAALAAELDETKTALVEALTRAERAEARIHDALDVLNHDGRALVESQETP